MCEHDSQRQVGTKKGFTWEQNKIRKYIKLNEWNKMLKLFKHTSRSDNFRDVCHRFNLFENGAFKESLRETNIQHKHSKNAQQWVLYKRHTSLLLSFFYLFPSLPPPLLVLNLCWQSMNALSDLMKKVKSEEKKIIPNERQLTLVIRCP